jgi:hypothetical protein
MSVERNQDQNSHYLCPPPMPTHAHVGHVVESRTSGPGLGSDPHTRPYHSAAGPAGLRGITQGFCLHMNPGPDSTALSQWDGEMLELRFLGRWSPMPSYGHRASTPLSAPDHPLLFLKSASLPLSFPLPLPAQRSQTMPVDCLGPLTRALGQVPCQSLGPHRGLVCYKT